MRMREEKQSTIFASKIPSVCVRHHLGGALRVTTHPASRNLLAKRYATQVTHQPDPQMYRIP